MKRNKVLDNVQIKRKLDRIARQLLEENFQESELVLMGIEGEGYEVAIRLEKILKAISKLPVRFESINLDKDNPLNSEISSSYETDSIKGKVVIIIDDVLNSGKTMIHAVKHVLESDPKGIYTVALIDRTHRSFPVRADFSGLSLATHVDQHITVKLNAKDPEKDAVYLEL